MHRVNVLSFEKDSLKTQELESALRDDGWPVASLDGRQFLHAWNPSDPAIAIVTLGAGALSKADQQTLLDRLNRANHIANICLIAGPFETADAEFYASFDDLIFWPCSRKELHARLSRFRRPVPFQSGSQAQQKILEDFAGMNLVGQSPVFMQLLAFIKRIARCDAAVLIEGETGTGKENAARAIHYLSDRRDGGFVPVNCGAIPDNLLESELFGHEKGAFTDAKTDRPGLVELASAGTLFLDEVDSLSPKAQSALLRFLQTHEYRPLGSRRLKHTDVRVIVATNVNLKKKVETGEFRGDLLFRMNVLSVYIPPLRDRTEDIEAIAVSLLSKYSEQYNSRLKTLHPKSLEWLKAQEWSGNVRELENVLLREFLLSEGPLIKCGSATYPVGMPARVAVEGRSVPAFQKAKEAAIEAFEIEYVNKVLEITSGNVTEAARIAGKERRAFGKLIKKHSVDKSEYRKILSHSA
jgi:DNA-binding NtrC family response regulator